jgi:hypothetical protein
MNKADLDAHVRRIVDAAPPLSPAQRDRIALLLRPALNGNRAWGTPDEPIDQHRNQGDTRVH